MNIENTFYNAKSCLDMARDKFDRQDYEASLVSLSKAMSHTRYLIEQVFKLQALKSDVESPAGGD